MLALLMESHGFPIMAILDSLLAVDEEYTSKYTLFNHVKAHYFYLWEYIFE